MSRLQTFGLLVLPSLLVLGLLLASAVRHLGLLREHTPEELRGTLHTGNEDARYYAALFLGNTGDQAAVPDLIVALERDASLRVRARAAYALGLLRNPTAVPALRAALGSGQEAVLTTAAWALGELGGKEAIPELAQQLTHPSPRARWNAAVALARLGSPLGHAVLWEMAAGTDPAGAVEAVRALALVAPAADLDRLRALPDRGWGAAWTQEVDAAATVFKARQGDGK